MCTIRSIRHNNQIIFVYVFLVYRDDHGIPNVHLDRSGRVISFTR